MADFYEGPPQGPEQTLSFSQVLALLGKIAGAVGPAVERYAKFVMPHMLGLIADNKKQVRPSHPDGYSP